MRWLRALLHLVLAIALVGGVPMPVAASMPAACDHHSAAGEYSNHRGGMDATADHVTNDPSGRDDNVAHAGHHAGMNASADPSGHHASMDHAGLQATAAAHPHGAPANAPTHKWDCCQTGCCVAPSQLTVASDASTVTFARPVRYGILAAYAFGRTETPEPGIPKAAG